DGGGEGGAGGTLADATSLGRARPVLARAPYRADTHCQRRSVVRTLLSTLAAAHNPFAAAFLVNASRHISRDRGEQADGRTQCELTADQPRRRADALRLRCRHAAPDDALRYGLHDR